MNRSIERHISRRFWGIVLCLFLVIVSVSVGTGEDLLRGYDSENGYVYVTLGEYPQTADGTVLPILWRVLDTDSEKCVLLSEYILFARCMNASLLDYREEMKGDFGQTDLCAYLNGEFAADAFQNGETDLLLPMDGIGKIFLPSAEDLQNKAYGLGITSFSSGNITKIKENPGLRAWGTEWAVSNNGYDPEEYSDPNEKLMGSSQKEMKLRELRLFVYSTKWASHSPYWTRDASQTDSRHARCIKADGSIGHMEVGRDNEGVRPMTWLAQGTFEIGSGSGTVSDPYTIVRRYE